MQFDSYHFENVTSTMEVIRQLLPNDKEKTQENGRGVIVTADFQREGRGRIEGRAWRTAPGTAMLATIAIPQDASQGAVLQDGLSKSQVFPLLAGLAVHSVLQEVFETQLIRAQSSSMDLTVDLGVDLTKRTPDRIPRPFLLKWPNDILGFAPGKGSFGHETPESISRGPVSGGPIYKKLSGILCEAIPGWFLAGIGLNLVEGSYPEELKDRATSLAEVLKASLKAFLKAPNNAPDKANGGSVPAFVPSFVPALESPDPAMDLSSYLARRIAQKIADELQNPFWKEEYEKNLWAKGARVSFVGGHPERSEVLDGVVEGIDEEGCLILALPNGEKRRFLAGEIASLEVSFQ